MYNRICAGKVQTFSTLKAVGIYKIECWGAQGSNILDKVGGKGGYCSGNIQLSKAKTLYIYVGAQSGGFGGGGVSADSERANNFGNDGGGATDVRLINGNFKDFNSLKSRIIVAAGGGGANHRNTADEVPQWGQGDGGYGGGLTGGDGIRDDGTISFATVPYLQKSTGATQTSSGLFIKSAKNSSGGFDDYTLVSTGRFGYSLSAPNYFVQSGGGGGYYAAAPGAHGGAAGGSSFISGYIGCDAIAASSTETNIIHTGQPNHYSGYIFTNSVMYAGNKQMPSPSGGTETGHSGNGACIITWIP